MQATVDSIGLRHLTRALTCLSKFGEDLIIVATPETFALSSTNQAQTAYGRFKYARSFFSKYRVSGGPAEYEAEEVTTITYQVAIKPLLQIMKHKTIEKSCEKCEFLISDGASQIPQMDDNAEDRDTLESRLTVRLHCKHGVVKTHRLPLNAANKLMSPSLPDAASESRLTIGPKGLRHMLEHFPFGKGSKVDPQLIWNFHDTDVQLRSLESSVDAKGRAQLTTELTISSEEFEEYDLQSTPMTIAFHLREFNATIAFAEASSLSLEIRFTDPDAPLYIDVGGDLADTMFVIATSHLQSFSPQNSQNRQADARAQSKGKKRPLEEDTYHGNAQAVERQRERTHSGHANRPEEQGAAPSQPLYGGPSQPLLFGEASQPYRRAAGAREPLFLPSSQLSQLPPAAEAAIIESGLGIEHMTAEELEDMLEGDAEEVEFVSQRSVVPDSQADAGDVASPPSREDEAEDWQIDDDMVFGDGGYGQQRENSLELIEDVEMAPTQNDGGTKVRDLAGASRGVLIDGSNRCSGRCSRISITALPPLSCSRYVRTQTLHRKHAHGLSIGLQTCCTCIIAVPIVRMLP
ncbi:uncharacterized protein TRAVEDRAFT_167684 [Trametes versicolor FP-101664 SS1]|uniref:uncharacterized protein n=1 Tax=Trametes versicolor (strain FP-101664) TaxID=717944 RepID=UPI0004624A00|nr:uncharacterized protein TRAVEDRAFT_167684 [Trametes versicolor FP-101664 SS1]EIW58231.1 hypothetical protein TRAVEDRAFT_167684 [Trametes versicolor FP-101664 SS1]